MSERSDVERQAKEIADRARAQVRREAGRAAGHEPVADWRCSCGADCFGASASYSAVLFDAHLADVLGERPE